MTYPRLVSFLLAAVAAACADRAPTAPVADLDAGVSSAAAGARAITVMTQNLYVGADVDLVIGALASLDPTDDIPALLFAIQTLGKTDFPVRAGAIADEIARVRPHAVGLQEVSVIDINLPPFGVFIHLDFLAILQAELAARGLNYTVAAQVQNTNAAPLPGISLVDFDALLVDPDRVSITSAGGQNFAANVGLVAPGVTLIRGWVWARTMIGDQSYTFASAHTEANLAGAPTGLLEQIRAAQVGEMVASLGSSDRVVLMGDLNDTPGSPMYQVMAAAGFTDVWAALRPGVVGLTCCHLADLSNRVAAFTQRIDYVLTRGLDASQGRLFGKIDRFGDVPADRVAGPAYRIWPSDHVGMVATVRP